MSFFGQVDHQVEVALGNVSGKANLILVATSTTIGTTYTDVWDQGGIMTRPTAAETYEMFSADTNDTSAGTGARTVSIVSLDASGNEQTTIATTNGGTATVSGTHRFPRIATVLTAGSNGVNVGDITIRVASAGAVRIKIPADEGVSNNAQLRVPTGKILHPLQFQYFSEKDEDVVIRPRTLIDIPDAASFSNASVPLYQAAFLSSISATVAIPANTEVSFQAKSTNPNVTVTIIAQYRLSDV
ncbi:MAG: hypothetical protein V3U84_11535 [Thiotrichaceae bacterium]